jgi:hypothetical protein
MVQIFKIHCVFSVRNLDSISALYPNHHLGDLDVSGSIILKWTSCNITVGYNVSEKLAASIFTLKMEAARFS